MRTFETYIQRELMKPFIVILLIFASLFAAFSSARLLAEAVTESLGVMAMAKLVALKTVIALEVLLPASLYIAVIAGLGRMYRDQELLVLQAAGSHPMRIVYAVMKLAIPVGLASAILSISIRPAAYAETYLLDLQAEAELNTDRFQAGRFYGNADTSSVVYIQDKDGENQEMQDVFYHVRDAGDTQLVLSKRARREAPAGERPMLHLFDGYLYEFSNQDDFSDQAEFAEQENKEESVTRFKKMVYSSSVDDELGYKRKAAPTRVLQASNSPRDIAELQWRLSRPFAAVLLVLIAISLSPASHRHKGEKHLIAALVFTVYYNLTGVARSWVEQGTVAPVPGIWWLYGLMLVIGLALLIPTLLRGYRITR